MSRVFILLTLANWLQCRGEIVEVTQTPASLHLNVGNSMEIHCKQDSNKEYMYWYQQRKREALKYIGRIDVSVASGDAQYEPEYSSRFEITRGESKAAYLKISNLTAEDSAVYFCAASLHVATNLSPNCHGEDVQVTQTPTSLYPNAGDSKEIHCEQKLNKNYMYWYQQRKREGLKLISYVNVVSVGDATKYEPGFTSRFHIRSKGNDAGSLKISNLTAEDSAVYFCAVGDHSGDVHTLEVTQTPTSLCKRVGDLSEMQCQHGDSNKDTMLWYQQNPGTGPKLIGYASGTSEAINEKDFPEDKFQIVKETDVKGSMIIQNLTAADSAVYFCAASQHVATNLSTNCTKTSQLNRGIYRPKFP
nr:PREDICTED: uncharacterized protein LOC102354443 [Latimeria chalumnae]|eukprot:XP_014347131.1 PREDICTED: uncharacterized protein LOC102354443 [Latimeria chalumnae]